MTTAEKVPGILGKIHAIQSELEVEKTGYDERNEYAYFKADDVARDVKALMNKHKVVHRTEFASINDSSYVDKNGRERARITGEVKVVFIDIEDGSEFTTDVMATGSDIGGDKATRKFQVQAFKIAAVDVFVVTEGIDKLDSDGDPEAEPDVAKDGEEVVVEKTAKEHDMRVREIVGDESNSITGADINEMGGKIAKSLGVGEKSTVWRKDVNVMKELTTQLEKLLKEMTAAAANGGEVE